MACSLSSTSQVSGCLYDSVSSVSEGSVRVLVGGSRILMGNSIIGTGCVLGANSGVSVAVPSPIDSSVLPRSVPLSVCCSSDSIVIIGGPDKVIMRPTINGAGSALMGTLVCRYGSLSTVGNIVETKVIRHVSGSASKLLITYGGSFTRRSLDSRFFGGAIGEGCCTVYCNSVGRGLNGVSTPVKESLAGERVVTMISGKGETIARFGMLSHFGNFALLSLVLSANEARRVEMRVGCVNRPLLNSPVCKPGGIIKSRKRFLRTGALKFVRPEAGSFLSFSDPLPSCFSSGLGSLQGGGWWVCLYLSDLVSKRFCLASYFFFGG